MKDQEEDKTEERRQRSNAGANSSRNFPKLLSIAKNSPHRHSHDREAAEQRVKDREEACQNRQWERDWHSTFQASRRGSPAWKTNRSSSCNGLAGNAGNGV